MTEQRETLDICEEISLDLYDVITHSLHHCGQVNTDRLSYQKLTDKEKQAVTKVTGENIFGIYSEAEVWLNIVLMLYTGRFMDARRGRIIKLFDKMWHVEWAMLVTTPQQTMDYIIRLEQYLPYMPYEIEVDSRDIPPELVAHWLYLQMLDCLSMCDYDTRQQMVQRSKEKMIERYIERRKSEEERTEWLNKNRRYMKIS